MKPSTSTMVAASLLVAIGGGILAVYPVTANPFGGPAAPALPAVVMIANPDGGTLRVGIDDSVRLDVSATTGPGVTLGVSGADGARLAVEATGTGGAPLYVTGPAGGPVISELGQQTANLITNPTCVFGVPQITTVGTTPVQLPTVTESHAEPTTKWALLNLSNTRRVCCMGIQPDGGVPDCTTKGYIAEPNGGMIILDGEQSTVSVYCRSSAGTADVNVWEASCVQ